VWKEWKINKGDIKMETILMVMERYGNQYMYAVEDTAGFLWFLTDNRWVAYGDGGNHPVAKQVEKLAVAGICVDEECVYMTVNVSLQSL
jgi:hypothetical protein